MDLNKEYDNNKYCLVFMVIVNTILTVDLHAFKNSQTAETA